MRTEDRYQHADHNDVLEFGPRYRPARGTAVTSAVAARESDCLIAQIFHRTTGGGRSALLTRPQAEELHAWLGRWLAEGWDGVPRRCQAVHQPDSLHRWECDQDPGHGGDHDGWATGWAAGERKTRQSWPQGRACPDGGTCHHGCAGGCWRTEGWAGPLTAAGRGDRWPAEVLAAEQAKGPSGGRL